MAQQSLLCSQTLPKQCLDSSHAPECTPTTACNPTVTKSTYSHCNWYRTTIQASPVIDEDPCCREDVLFHPLHLLVMEQEAVRQDNVQIEADGVQHSPLRIKHLIPDSFLMPLQDTRCKDSKSALPKFTQTTGLGMMGSCLFSYWIA